MHSQNALRAEPAPIVDCPQWRNREQVFEDRHEGGCALASLLNEQPLSNALLLAIPAGGVPVAVEVSRQLKIPLGLAIAAKINYPGLTESGFGAVAFEGTQVVDTDRVETAGLESQAVELAAKKARLRVTLRQERFGQYGQLPAVRQRTVIVIDDGLATGLTMLATVRALRLEGAVRLIVAAPTGHDASARRLADEADRICIPNLRSGGPFAVADAYRQWRDVEEAEVIGYLKQPGVILADIT